MLQYIGTSVSLNWKEKHRVSDAELLINGIGYLTALAQTKLSGDFNYSDRNIVEKLLQTFTMRIN
jgi:putative transposase